MTGARYVNAANVAQAAELGEALLHTIGLPTTERRAAAKTTAYSSPVLLRGDESLVPVLERHVTDAAAWVQPEGAHDAYATGRVVIHADKIWLNLTDANVFEPGVSGWREIPPPGQLPAWVQPTGAHDAYALGALVDHGGTAWRSNRDGNIWEPGTFDSGWEEASEIVVPPGVLEWAPGQVVAVDDLRTYEGVTYRCIQAHTTQADWTPPATPSLWEVV